MLTYAISRSEKLERELGALRAELRYVCVFTASFTTSFTARVCGTAARSCCETEKLTNTLIIIQHEIQNQKQKTTSMGFFLLCLFGCLAFRFFALFFFYFFLFTFFFLPVKCVVAKETAKQRRAHP